MNRMGVGSLLAILFTSGAHGQTGCATKHPEPGVFVCYPNPSEHKEDGEIGTAFHVSAQANAPKGRKIGTFVLLIDDSQVYQSRLAMPLEQLSIEVNVKSPFPTGTHTIRLTADGAGSAEVPAVTFRGQNDTLLCDPFSRVDPRNCVPLNSPGPLIWSLRSNAAKPSDAFSEYLDYLQLYSRNLKRVEADLADAVAVDDQGSLYTASHTLADVEVRKYSPNGSLVYDQLVRSCGKGFVSVEAMAVDHEGRVWVGGNRTACLTTTPNALQPVIQDPDRPHAFVLGLDTAKPGPDSQVYVSYLSRCESQMKGLRISQGGDIYITGVTASMQFPHQSTLDMGKSLANQRGTRIGFISCIDSSGSRLLWSTVLPGAQLNGLVLGDADRVYVTGRVGPRRAGSDSSDILVAEISEHGRRLSYAARLGGSGMAEGRAVSIDKTGTWLLVAGATDKGNFLGGAAVPSQSAAGDHYLGIALQPCRNGGFYTERFSDQIMNPSVPIALQPALDVFGSAFRPVRPRTQTSAAKARRAAIIDAVSNCTSSTP